MTQDDDQFGQQSGGQPGERPPSQPPSQPPGQQPPPRGEPTPPPGYQPPGYQPPGYQPPGYPPPPPPGYPPQQPPQQPPGYPPQQPPGYPAAPPPAAGYGYGALPPVGGQLPPGVVVASSGRRVGAYFLAIPLLIVTLVIGYIIWGLVAWSKGTTPALQVLGMKVWDTEEHRPPGFGKMALREIVGAYICEGICIIVGIVSFIMFLGADRQAIHDKVAKTIVVYDPNKVLG